MNFSDFAKLIDISPHLSFFVENVIASYWNCGKSRVIPGSQCIFTAILQKNSRTFEMSDFSLNPSLAKQSKNTEKAAHWSHFVIECIMKLQIYVCTSGLRTHREPLPLLAHVTCCRMSHDISDFRLHFRVVAQGEGVVDASPCGSARFSLCWLLVRSVVVFFFLVLLAIIIGQNTNVLVEAVDDRAAHKAVTDFENRIFSSLRLGKNAEYSTF